MLKIIYKNKLITFRFIYANVEYNICVNIIGHKKEYSIGHSNCIVAGVYLEAN